MEWYSLGKGNRVEMENEIISEGYDTVKQHVGLFDFPFEGKLKIKGEGRVNFIDAITSNDVKNLNENHGIYSSFLDSFGRVLSDCIIYKFSDFLLLNLNIIGKRNILEKLISEAKLGKSEVEDISFKYALFSLQGPKALELINKIIKEEIDLTKQYQFTTKKISIFKKNNNEEIELIIAKNNRTTEDGYDIFVPASHYKEFKELIQDIGKDFNLGLIDGKTYDLLRLEAKIPLYSVDFDQKNIINEVSEKAVSYEKGCFLGQEIVARIKNIAHGVTSKKLMSIEIDSNEVPKKNSKIMKDGKEAGQITSAAFSPGKNKVIAMGIIKKDFYDEKIGFTVDDKEAELENIE